TQTRTQTHWAEKQTGVTTGTTRTKDKIKGHKCTQNRQYLADVELMNRLHMRFVVHTYNAMSAIPNQQCLMPRGECCPPCVLYCLFCCYSVIAALFCHSFHFYHEKANFVLLFQFFCQNSKAFS